MTLKDGKKAKGGKTDKVIMTWPHVPAAVDLYFKETCISHDHLVVRCGLVNFDDVHSGQPTATTQVDIVVAIDKET